MLVIVACSGNAEFDRRIQSADENYMSELAGQLDAAGIDFRVGRDGSIAYRSRDEDAFRSIDERVKKQIAAGAMRKHSETKR
ncbi:MAG TPA: hypothetical protein VED01_15875 [Burkholderiales bacterium]|nr:hypothetical protein [Burkholderiales bacterium]